MTLPCWGRLGVPSSVRVRGRGPCRHGHCLVRPLTPSVPRRPVYSSSPAQTCRGKKGRFNENSFNQVNQYGLRYHAVYT